MKIGIPKEIHEGEKRVAATPEAAEQIIKLGFSMSIESGAGAGANISDEAYREVGVEIVSDVKALWKNSDVIIKVRAPERHPELAVDEIEMLAEGACLISFIWPAQNEALMKKLADRKVTVLAMDSVPRISRAQKLLGYQPVVFFEQGLEKAIGWYKENLR